jgi:predicted nucleic acid-binding protein
LTLVLDANVVLAACTRDDGFADFGTEALVAPPLMWSEFLSGLREGVWRGARTEDEAEVDLSVFRAAPVRMHTHPDLLDEAWKLARAFGWAKTYDAEYVALAALLDCTLITLDGRLRRGTDRLGFVLTPPEWLERSR